jgi:hypothetical protein
MLHDRPAIMAPSTTQPSISAMKVDAMSGLILDIVFEYSLNKFEDTPKLLEAGRPKFLSVIGNFIRAGKPIEMCLPAFPFKARSLTQTPLIS